MQTLDFEPHTSSTLKFHGDETFRPEPLPRESVTGYPIRVPGGEASDWATEWMTEVVHKSGESLKSQRLAKFPTRLQGSLDADWGAEWMGGEGSCCGSCAAGGECEGGDCAEVCGSRCEGRCTESLPSGDADIEARELIANNSLYGGYLGYQVEFGGLSAQLTAQFNPAWVATQGPGLRTDPDSPLPTRRPIGGGKKKKKEDPGKVQLEIDEIKKKKVKEAKEKINLYNCAGLAFGDFHWHNVKDVFPFLVQKCVKMKGKGKCVGKKKIKLCFWLMQRMRVKKKATGGGQGGDPKTLELEFHIVRVGPGGKLESKNHKGPVGNSTLGEQQAGFDKLLDGEAHADKRKPNELWIYQQSQLQKDLSGCYCCPKFPGSILDD